MYKQLFFLLFGSLPAVVFAQNTEPNSTDTIKSQLNTVIIKAYEQEKNQLATPASVGTVNQQDLERFNNTTILPAVNNIPGVRMEQRSPGSYRFGIRGSAFNAPFGVRNIKVYYNDIPYTDAGGNTYLNQLGYYNYQSLEIIKGPGSSLYGAGTGGVLLINSMPENWQPGGFVNTTVGSYGLYNLGVRVNAGNEHFKNTITYQRFAADGYREHSSSRKDIISWDSEVGSGKWGKLMGHFLYSDISYETPGGLTLRQYDSNDKIARPPTNFAPGAVESKAAIYQKTFLGGLTYQKLFNNNWLNRTTVYTKYTNLVNPNIRNYSNVYQPSYGARSVFKYNNTWGNVDVSWVAGAELQQGNSFENTYATDFGLPDTLQQQNEITNTNVSGFTQLTASYNKLIVTGGVSINALYVDLTTYKPYGEAKRDYGVIAAPRLAILYRVLPEWSIFTSAAYGFTPPTTEQLAPSGSAINLGLKPTAGWNYELGTKASVLNNKLYVEATAFYMDLSDAIVQRRDSLGGDYYINAGGTTQTGLELLVNYGIIDTGYGFLRSMKAFASYTGYRYRYYDFIQVDEDFSGNRVPGIPAATVAAGLDINTSHGIYMNLNAYYADIIPLNDANSVYGSSYIQLNTRLGYKFNTRWFHIELYGGVNNILNEKYSLGNDINAFGGRYYNTGAGINYYGGLLLGL